MKPDTPLCLYCGQEIDGRADKKFCSEAHYKAFVRANGAKYDISTTKPGQTKPDKQIEGVKKHGDIQNEISPDKLRESLTKTDKTFYDRAMRDFKKPYYKFNEEPIKEETCLECDKKFKTTLRLLKFCSYQHYQDAIRIKR